MEELIKESENNLNKIHLIESFISLHLRRETIEPQIQELAEKTEEVKTLIEQCNQVMKVEYASAIQEHSAIMRKMQEQQLKILSILIERQKNLNVKPASKGVLPEKLTKTGQLTIPAIQFIKGDTGTPKMYLGDYLQSPFVKKTKPAPVPFQFLDFEVEISPEMFESVPKYMRGRETLDELKNFLDTILVPCFNEKYQLLYRERNCIRNHVDLDLWKVYKEQTSYFPGQNFITQGDISRKIKKMVDKKSQNKITMLRHLGILQETRKAHTVCYIWTANNV